MMGFRRNFRCNGDFPAGGEKGQLAEGEMFVTDRGVGRWGFRSWQGADLSV